MQSQPARELTPEEVQNMTDEQLGHLGLDYDNLSVNSYTLIANEAKRRKVKDIGGRYVSCLASRHCNSFAIALPTRSSCRLICS